MSWSSVALADAGDARPNATPTANAQSGSLGASVAGPPDTGVSLGARLGYMLPLGSLQQDGDLSKAVSGGVPIILDAGYRFTPNIYLGLYGQYAFTFVAGDACGSGASCSAHDIRFGINAHYHFQPKENVDPWVGIGIGYEWLTVSESSGNVSGDTSVSGFEFVNLQGGVDFKATPAFRVGPFVSLSFSEYGSASTSLAGSSTSSDIQNKALHEWFTFGVRGQYDL